MEKKEALRLEFDNAAGTVLERNPSLVPGLPHTAAVASLRAVTVHQHVLCWVTGTLPGPLRNQQDPPPSPQSVPPPCCVTWLL